MRLSFVSPALLLAALGAPVAHAGPEGKAYDRRAAAAALFHQGISDMEAGKTAEGCAKLAESVATMPDSGAMGALAECDTALGRLAEAWDLWHDLASSAPTAELREDAAKNAAALDARLARVTIRLRGEAPADLVVTLNDKPVPAGEVTERRVLPGKLVAVATSPDTERWSQTVTVKQGETIEIEVPVVASQGAVHRRARNRVIGLSFLGVGVLGLAIGATYGGIAYAHWSSASSSCGGDTDHCKSAGYANAQSELAGARSAATISSWSTAIGVGATATGLIVYLLSREPKTESAMAWRAAPMAGPRTVGITLTRSLP